MTSGPFGRSEASDWIRKVAEDLTRFRYKPGTAIAVDPTPWPDAARLCIVRTVVDAEGWRTRGEAITSGVTSSQELMRCEYELGGIEWLKMFVEHAIRKMEMHEVDEFLTFDGTLLRDPHPPGHS